MTARIRFFAAACVLMALAGVTVPALAQKAKVAGVAGAAGPAVQAAPVAPVDAASLSDRITRPMRAVAANKLRAEGVSITLWGVRPAQSSSSLIDMRALELMDTLIQEQQVTCKIVGGAMPELIGRCATQDNQDLALELLNNGYATVDRLQTFDTVFASAYEKAQEGARLAGKGFWADSFGGNKAAAEPLIPGYLKVLLPIGLIFGPFGGLLVVAMVMRHWLKNLAEQQKEESDRAFAKEERLQTRERQVLITTLEAELLDNKSRIEAFLVIYKDMLQDLKNPSQKPKYQEAGDIIQKHPNFSKLVFESNVSKLSLLDIKLARELSKLYGLLEKESEYVNIEPSLPLDTMQKLVERVVHDAEELVPQIDSAVRDLQEAASGI